MYPQIDLVKHVSHPSTYPLLLSGSSKIHALRPTYILKMAYSEDWHEFHILPFQLRLSGIDVRAESERAKSVTLLCGQEGLSYITY